MLRRTDARRFLRPFHDAHPVAEQILVQAKVRYLGQGVQTVEVDVVEGEAGLVLRHEHEGGAAGVLVPTQAPEDPLREAGLTGSQPAHKRVDVAGPGVLSQDPADGLGLIGATADDLDGE